MSNNFYDEKIDTKHDKTEERAKLSIAKR